MKKVFFFLILSIAFKVCFADPEPPVIRSFVDITLRDGTKIQGAITIAKPLVAKGRYYYIANGIYCKNGKNEGIMKFNLDLQKIELNKIKSGFSNAQYEYGGWVVFPDSGEPTFEFVDCYRIDPIQNEYEHLFEEGILLYHENLIQRYHFLDYIPVQEDVSYYYDTINVRKIPLKNILKIELISNPSEDFLKQIIEHNNQIDIVMADSGSGDGYNKPIWYHEIIKNKEEYFRLLQMNKY